MEKAVALVANNPEPSPREKKLLLRSSSNFESGISTFDLINDRLVKRLFNNVRGVLISWVNDPFDSWHFSPLT